MTEGKKIHPIAQTVWIVIVASLSIGFLELAGYFFNEMIKSDGFLAAPAIYKIFVYLCASFGFYFIFICIVYIIVWSVLVYPLKKIFALSMSRQDTAFVLFVSGFFILTILLIGIFLRGYSFIPLRFKETNIAWGFIFSLALLSMLAFYSVLKSTVDVKEKIYNALSILGPALPFLICEFCVLIYCLCYWKIPLLSALSFLAFMLFFAVIALSLRFFVRLKPTRRAWSPVIFFVLLVVLTPLLTFLSTFRKAELYVPSANAAHPIENVILITIDTLRADALSCYQSNGAPTPHIDQLAEDGILFQNALSNAPWTLPSLISIMTGLSPSVHKGDKVNRRLHENFPTLAQRMLENGYYTSAIGYNGFLFYGLAKGFLESDFYPQKTIPIFSYLLIQQFFPLVLPKQMSRKRFSTEQLTQAALTWLKKNSGQDFFFWLHYYDPHTPYSPPRRYLEGLTPEPRIGKSFSHPKHKDMTTAEIEWIKTLYHAEVRYVDDNIGELVAELKRLGYLRRIPHRFNKRSRGRIYVNMAISGTKKPFSKNRCGFH